ncbi:MAG: molybdopterin-synthase adenylyltransferase MoeB [Pseudomonadota bacterium]|nr:molybdopterin-synthase adenylyltransferase MoeB [Pseudomonadota bacterium]MEE2749772.1 molybdopterin-synthase adenylyltransferase MoeB [Pseudomonadota bacterium]
MKDDHLLRYSRHILLPEVDIEGQEAISQATVVVIGLGGLGSPVALYLAASGVGHLILVDDDQVEVSNLQRQVVHDSASVGLSKVESAAQRCQAVNPDVKISCCVQRADSEWLKQQDWLSSEGGFNGRGGSDDGLTVIVDCSDNAAVRYAINDVCLQNRIPWVSGAAVALNGQIAVFDPREEGAPCYRCLYPALQDGALTCSENGILSPVVGVIGTTQVVEALRLIVGFGAPQHGYLRTYDVASGDWQRWKVPARQTCSCQSGYCSG